MAKNIIAHNRVKIDPATLRRVRRLFRASTGAGYYANARDLPLDLGELPPHLLRLVQRRGSDARETMNLWRGPDEMNGTPDYARPLARLTDATIAMVTGGQKRKGTFNWIDNPPLPNLSWHFDPISEEWTNRGGPFESDIDGRAPDSVQLLLQPALGQAMVLPEPRTRTAAAALRRRIQAIKDDTELTYNQRCRKVDLLLRRLGGTALKPKHMYLISGRTWHRGPHPNDASARGKGALKTRRVINAEYSWSWAWQRTLRKRAASQAPTPPRSNETLNR